MKKNKKSTLDLPYAAREMIFAAGLEQLMKETGVTLGIATREFVPQGLGSPKKKAPTKKVAKKSEN